MTDKTNAIGRVIREIRKEADLKQKDLADKAGIHKNTLLNIEKGRSEPGEETLEAIAGVLGVDVTVFFDAAEADPLPDGVTSSKRAPRDREGLYHFVVREPPVDYPRESAVQDDVEAILEWIPENMSRRLSKEVDDLVRLAEIYAYGAHIGWSADRMEYIHKTRQRLEALRRAED